MKINEVSFRDLIRPLYHLLGCLEFFFHKFLDLIVVYRGLSLPLYLNSSCQMSYSLIVFKH